MPSLPTASLIRCESGSDLDSVQLMPRFVLVYTPRPGIAAKTVLVSGGTGTVVESGAFRIRSLMTPSGRPALTLVGLSPFSPVV